VFLAEPALPSGRRHIGQPLAGPNCVPRERCEDMTDDDALQMIKKRIAETTLSACAPADAEAVARAESAVGFKFPRFYVRLLTEVANGGFGPGYGIIGIPPDGFQDDDLNATLTDAYLQGRDPSAGAYRTPRGLLYLCNWGCGSFSYVDCLTELPRVVTHEACENGLEYAETAPSLAWWLGEWAQGVDVGKEMYEVTGYRDGINPFTGKPHMFPTVRMKGARVDFSDRS